MVYRLAYSVYRPYGFTTDRALDLSIVLEEEAEGG